MEPQNDPVSVLVAARLVGYASLFRAAARACVHTREEEDCVQYD